MAYTTINKSTDYFNTKLWTGTGSNGNAISGVGFAPDLVWVKNRSGTYDHVLFDRVRGDNKHIESNNNSAEENEANTLAFGSDGYSVGTNTLNNSGSNIVGWNWKANGQGSSNTDGSINTTYTSVNTTAGFSISKYTGTGANATFGHGLGVKPDIVFWKRTDNSAGAVNWIVQSPLLGNQTKLVLNTTEATSTGSSFSQTDNWTNSLIDLKTYEGENSSGGTYIAYAFASKTGYSKIGSYVGNGNANGTFIYTGFKPAFVMLKETSNADNWIIMDNKRLGYNPRNDHLFPNTNAVEYATDRIDLVSNGIKINNDDGGINTSGATYIYMAIGQSLVGSNNVPCTAR